MEKQNKKSSLLFLYEGIGAYKIGIFILTLFHIVLGVSSICLAMMMRNTLDSATQQEKQLFLNNLLLFIAIIVSQIVIRNIVSILAEYLRSSIENQFKIRLFGNLLEEDYETVRSIHSGEWMNRLTSDVAIVANTIVEILPNFAQMSVKLVSALLMIVIMERKFLGILVSGGLILLVMSYLVRKVLKNLHKKVQESDGALRIFMQERLANLVVVKAFVAEKNTRKKALAYMERHRKDRMKKAVFSTFCNTGFVGAMNGMYVVGFAYCSYGILEGTISYGTMLAILQLISQIQSPFVNLTGYFPKFYAMLASSERIMFCKTQSDELDCSVRTLQEIQSMYQNDFTEIDFKNVSFTYKEKNIQVFSHINFQIKKGDCIAFVGHSGCGKSTLFQLLLSLYSVEEGTITINFGEKGKVPLSNVWRKMFAYVPQGNQLMNGTIREIVSMEEWNKEDMSQKESQIIKVEKALSIACADEFVAQLPNKINTFLGERGAGLSEGQMQRIAIARAIYADSPILLFDESTSALDEYTERIILKNLKCMTDKTILIVTHRPAIFDICNRIVEVTENGIEEKK